VRPHPGNARLHDDDGIRESIRVNGQYRPVVVSRDGVILAGNGTYAAMLAEGAESIAATFVDVDAISDEATRIVLVDNKLNDQASYDMGLLLNLVESVGDLEGTGYDAQALDELVAAVNTAGHMPLEDTGDPDSVPEAPAEPTTKRGDIIVLGRHRLMCGDSVNPDDVRVLLNGVAPDMAWCDPPYGVSVADGGRVGISNVAERGTYAPIIGDNTTQTAIDAYNLCATLRIPVMIWWGANYYASALPDSPCWILWDKQNDGNPFADGELAWVNLSTPIRIFRHQWQGMIRASERGEKRVHPTQKPVALAEWCYENYGAKGDSVLDLFGGSGTSLIAAEKTGRTAYLMEMSEAYCDVTIRRWEVYSGKTATRLKSNERDTD